MSLDNGLVNLAAIVSAIVVLIGTIPAILLLTTPKTPESGASTRADEHK
ncbi:MAG TPA: hypothetical protein VF395_06305 [Polyangiaceae bacterium]